MIKCLLSSISTRISLEPVRTPGTVASTFSPFLKKFLELDPLTGPEQALCVCIESRYWFAAESLSCILGHSNSSSFFFWISFCSILVLICPCISVCFYCIYWLLRFWNWYDGQCIDGYWKSVSTLPCLQDIEGKREKNSSCVQSDLWLQVNCQKCEPKGKKHKKCSSSLVVLSLGATQSVLCKGNGS